MTSLQTLLRARAALQVSRDQRFRIKAVPCPPPRRRILVEVNARTFPDRDNRLRYGLHCERVQGRMACDSCKLFVGHAHGCLEQAMDLWLMEIRPGVDAIRRRTMADRIRDAGL